MDKEVEPAVLTVLNEKRLQGDKRTPVDIITRMGVTDARDKASDYAWLATGGNVIATIWAEFVQIGAGGRWFILESLDVDRRADGAERTALQAQRTEDRLRLLKKSLDAGQGVRAVLQTNRVAAKDMDTDKAARVSVRVPDDEEWHVAAWQPAHKLAVLVRGARGWQPDEAELQAARERRGIAAVTPQGPGGPATRESVQAAAMEHLVKHFTGYGYTAEDVRGQQLGHDIEVSDKKGNTLLKLAVKGTGPGVASFQLSAQERASASRGDPWRMAVVTDAGGPTAQHRLYKGSELNNASGLEPQAD